MVNPLSTPQVANLLQPVQEQLLECLARVQGAICHQRDLVNHSMAVMLIWEYSAVAVLQRNDIVSR